MRLIVFLSGENLPMARAEFLANLEKQRIRCRPRWLADRIFCVEIERAAKFDDLALTHEVCQFLGNFSGAKKIDWKKTFKGWKRGLAVRAKKIPPRLPRSGTGFEKKIGKIFWEQGIKIDFKSPQIVRIYLTKRKTLLGKVMWQNKEPFQARRAHLRPFVSPISMHPKFARAMVNLARLKKSDKVLDPFCGTGGLLIEAGLVGVKVYGIDIDPRLISGCKRNLRFYNINSKNIRQGDALAFAPEYKDRCTAIVTELPFGKSTRLTMPKRLLYKKFLALVPKILSRGFAVISCDEKIKKIPKGLNLLDHFKIYVHKKMARHIFVFKIK